MKSSTQFRYSRVEKLINELLDRYGIDKFCYLLESLSDNIDDQGLLDIEELFRITAKEFNTTRRKIMNSSSKSIGAVYSRRAIIYILRTEGNLEFDVISMILKIKRSDNTSRMFNYTDDCVKGNIVDSYYSGKLEIIKKQFLDHLEKSRTENIEANN